MELKYMNKLELLSEISRLQKEIDKRDKVIKTLRSRGDKWKKEANKCNEVIVSKESV